MERRGDALLRARQEPLDGRRTTIGGYRQLDVGGQLGVRPSHRRVDGTGQLQRLVPRADQEHDAGVPTVGQRELLGVDLSQPVEVEVTPEDHVVVVAGAAGGPRRADRPGLLEPIDQPLEPFRRVGDRQPARDDRIGQLLLPAANDTERLAAVIDRPDRVGCLLVPGIVAHHPHEDLDGLFQQLRVAGRDHEVDARLAAGLDRDVRDDPAAGQVAEPAIPGRVELAGDHIGDRLDLLELGAFQELPILRQQLERVLDPGIGQPVDEQIGMRDLQRDHRRRVHCARRRLVTGPGGRLGHDRDGRHRDQPEADPPTGGAARRARRSSGPRAPTADCCLRASPSGHRGVSPSPQAHARWNHVRIAGPTIARPDDTIITSNGRGVFR